MKSKKQAGKGPLNNVQIIEAMLHLPRCGSTGPQNVVMITVMLGSVHLMESWGTIWLLAVVPNYYQVSCIGSKILKRPSSCLLNLKLWLKKKEIVWQNSAQDVSLSFFLIEHIEKLNYWDPIRSVAEVFNRKLRPRIISKWSATPLFFEKTKRNFGPRIFTSHCY